MTAQAPAGLRRRRARKCSETTPTILTVIETRPSEPDALGAFRFAEPGVLASILKEASATVAYPKGSAEQTLLDRRRPPPLSNPDKSTTGPSRYVAGHNLSLDKLLSLSIQLSLAMIKMIKWSTSFVLITVLAGSVLAGIPMHSNEQACSMGGEMDCCKAALMQTKTPAVAAARLCCAMNCSQSGTTAPSSAIPLSPQVAVAAHPAATQPLVSSPVFVSSLSRSHGPPANSPYHILHLALLI